MIPPYPPAWPEKALCQRKDCAHPKSQHRLVVRLTRIYRGSCANCECIKYIGVG